MPRCNAAVKNYKRWAARSIPVLKIGDQIMVGWNQKNFDKMYKLKKHLTLCKSLYLFTTKPEYLT